MLATEGSVDKLKSTQWAFEGKWDGYRLLVDANHGELQPAFAAAAATSPTNIPNSSRSPPISPTIT